MPIRRIINRFARRRSLNVEHLEDKLLLATTGWNGGVGAWSTPGKWNNGTPSQGDTAQFTLDDSKPALTANVAAAAEVPDSIDIRNSNQTVFNLNNLAMGSYDAAAGTYERVGDLNVVKDSGAGQAHLELDNGASNPVMGIMYVSDVNVGKEGSNADAKALLTIKENVTWDAENVDISTGVNRTDGLLDVKAGANLIVHDTVTVDGQAGAIGILKVAGSVPINEMLLVNGKGTVDVNPGGKVITDIAFVGDTTGAARTSKLHLVGTDTKTAIFEVRAGNVKYLVIEKTGEVIVGPNAELRLLGNDQDENKGYLEVGNKIVTNSSLNNGTYAVEEVADGISLKKLSQLDGDFEQTSDGKLVIHLGGPNAGAETNG
jgi:hypothetical protein